MSRSLLVAFAALLILPLAHAAEPSDKRAAAIEELWKAESIGGLKRGLTEKEVIQKLGKPESQGKLVKQEADGSYVQDWKYPAQGLVLTMSPGEKKTGTRRIYAVMATGKCKLATSKGIKLGSAEAAARKAYAAFEDPDRKTPTDLAVSANGGELSIGFENGKVNHLTLGPGPE